MDDKEKLYNLMIKKSKESFLLAIELFNKPTISLNVECFCIFICNAWDLLLKAYLIKQDKSIFKDNNDKKTYSLTKIINKIFTSRNDEPLKQNLFYIINIRNLASHYVIPEYSQKTHSLFISCLKNYSEKLFEFHNIKVTDFMDTTFLSLIIPSNKTEYTIIGKYGASIEKHFNNMSKHLDKLYKKMTYNGIIDEHFAINQTITFVKAKNEQEADFKLYLTENTKNTTTKYINPTISHPYSRKNIVSLVQKRIDDLKLEITRFIDEDKPVKFTTHAFDIYIKYNKVKENKIFCFNHIVGNNISYTYSNALINKIISDIKNDKDIFYKIKQEIKKMKLTT